MLGEAPVDRLHLMLKLRAHPLDSSLASVALVSSTASPIAPRMYWVYNDGLAGAIVSRLTIKRPARGFNTHRENRSRSRSSERDPTPELQLKIERRKRNHAQQHALALVPNLIPSVIIPLVGVIASVRNWGF
jgi:hypothetical protein